MLDWLVIIVAWVLGAVYVAGITTAMLVVYMWPMPGRFADSCWTKYKDRK